MTLFTQIYSDAHNFLQGVITIPNTATNLAKAYLETIVDGIVDNTAQPILLGFLYQVDASLRRSKPYPIVSQRQTIPLDMSECANFLFVPVSRFIDDYTLSLYVSSESSGGAVDLSAYALISQLPDLAPYARLIDIPNLSNYVSNSQLATALANYALTSQLPDLSAYALKTEINGFSVKSQSVSISQGQSTTVNGVVLGIFEQVGYNQVSPSNMTSNSSLSPIIASSSSQYDSSYGAWRCFDGQVPNEPDFASSGALSSDWIALDFGSASKVVRRYSIFPSNVSIVNSNTPKQWTFQGSLNNTDWVTLDSQSNISGWVGATPKVFDFTNSVAYRYYRLNVTGITVPGGLLRIGEIQMFELLGDSYKKSDANYQVTYASTTGTQTVTRTASGGVNAIILYA
ncbi:discoidin domain-containing protein [Pseudanabaena yagii]|uniref:Discoidin domain-containing protein n=1 Tax=Pseudanabaena yagii GIHE-NHR1 TaxID=2722753 RepID=A0ABX1LVF5_9CYAN|nr:discoidin domain-containing protein [Pseudanabaena yagii]NMF60167.1 discoidin domain-containing protein [Pseudanabaena yagii GIHE-NHR1]